MNRYAVPSPPARGPAPARAQLGALDYDDIEDTTPSTPYPCARFHALSRWLNGARSWFRVKLGVAKAVAR